MSFEGIPANSGGNTKVLLLPDINIVDILGGKRNRPRKSRNTYEAFFDKSYLDGYLGWKFQGNKNIGGRGKNTKVTNFNKLEIFIGDKKISIPMNIKSNLLNLLKNPNTHYLDCRRFAGAIIGIGSQIQGPRLKEKHDSSFTPGKAYGFINISDKNKELKNGANGGEYHFFISLGNGLFIGKPGRNAEIVITEYAEMVKGFQGDYGTLVEVD